MKYRKPTKAIITDAGCASRFLPITTDYSESHATYRRPSDYATNRRGMC